MKKKRIAVDIDDVLANTISGIIEFHNANYETRLSLDDFRFDRFYKTWGGDAMQEQSKLQLFYKSKHYKNLKPVKGSKEVIQKLCKYFELFIVTARDEKFREITTKWIEKYYGDSFKEIHFANHYSEYDESIPKSKICSILNADFLIDDSLEYAQDCATGDRKVLLFDYPWNRDITLPRSILRVHSWEDIKDFFQQVVQKQSPGFYF
jgi:5'(3')-deoxyribonucleotidase